MPRKAINWVYVDYNKRYEASISNCDATDYRKLKSGSVCLTILYEKTNNHLVLREGERDRGNESP